MNNIDRFKKIVNTEIKYIRPIKLEELSSKFKASTNFPDLKSSFEFPPKSIDVVLEIFFDKRYEKLNFFDVARLLQQIEQDLLCFEIANKSLFIKLLQELFKISQKHIQNMILRIVTKILMKTSNHSLKDTLQTNMTTKEFIFIDSCLKKNFSIVKSYIKNLNLKKVLQYYGLDKILNDLQSEYANYLLDSINNDIDLKCFQNNLLIGTSLDSLYSQLNKLIFLIEYSDSSNNIYLDLIISEKLGNVEDKNSNWYVLSVPLELIDKYKRLKGLFEFQVFVQICKYLSPSLKDTNLSSNGKTSDATRLMNRSDFWSNYDSRFLSVKIWVSENDYSKMLSDKPTDMSNIKQLRNINNEVCLLEFKENKLLIIEFFRLRDTSKRFYSLVFEGEKIEIVKNLLNEEDFTVKIYEYLEKIANYSINQDYCWQGWIDKFLRERNIFPNELILKGKNKFKGIKYLYDKKIGLEQTRKEALDNERIVAYDDVIIFKNSN